MFLITHTLTSEAELLEFIQESSEKYSKIIIEIISKLMNPKLKKYWLMVLKYPLSSLVPGKSDKKDLILDYINELLGAK